MYVVQVLTCLFKLAVSTYNHLGSMDFSLSFGLKSWTIKGLQFLCCSVLKNLLKVSIFMSDLMNQNKENIRVDV